MSSSFPFQLRNALPPCPMFIFIRIWFVPERVTESACTEMCVMGKENGCASVWSLNVKEHSAMLSLFNFNRMGVSATESVVTVLRVVSAGEAFMRSERLL